MRFYKIFRIDGPNPLLVPLFRAHGNNGRKYFDDNADRYLYQILYIKFHIISSCCAPITTRPFSLELTDGIAQQIGKHPSYLLTIYEQFTNFLFRIFTSICILNYQLAPDLPWLHILSVQYRLSDFRHHLQFSGFTCVIFSSNSPVISRQTLAIFLMLFR